MSVDTTMDNCPFRAPGDIDGRGRPREPICDGIDCICIPGPTREVPQSAVRTRHHVDLACGKCGYRLALEAYRRGESFVIERLRPCRVCGATLRLLSDKE